MKTLKKTVSLFLSAIMILSVSAFVIANADDNTDPPSDYESESFVNVRINPPVAGEKADETIIVDDERYIPGSYDIRLFWGLYPSDCYDSFGRVPEPEEYIDKIIEERMAETDSKYTAFFSAYYQAAKHMIKNGIIWVEYEYEDWNKLVRAGLTYYCIDDNPPFYFTQDFVDLLLRSSEVYGLSVTGDDGKEYSTSTRFMQPGETFKEGKLYICFCNASLDISDELSVLIENVNDLMPYEERWNEINEKLDNTSDEEEKSELYSQRDALEEEYKNENHEYLINNYKLNNRLYKETGDGYGMPWLTVNGEDTGFIYNIWLDNKEYSLFSARVYDFGINELKIEEPPTFLDRIIDFFNSIIDFFKNLFSFIKF
ncbi:MAG: hypothetical protein IKH13_04265 [Clostridia bacterium]|nr:hypothetical protein [Clostridia bacterium]